MVGVENDQNVSILNYLGLQWHKHGHKRLTSTSVTLTVTCVTFCDFGRFHLIPVLRLLTHSCTISGRF